jgi:hypothetical protein
MAMMRGLSGASVEGLVALIIKNLYRCEVSEMAWKKLPVT